MSALYFAKHGRMLQYIHIHSVHNAWTYVTHSAKAWVHGVHTLYVVEARMHVIHTGTEHDTHTYTQPLMSLCAHETVWV